MQSHFTILGSTQKYHGLTFWEKEESWKAIQRYMAQYPRMTREPSLLLNVIAVVLATGSIILAGIQLGRVFALFL